MTKVDIDNVLDIKEMETQLLYLRIMELYILVDIIVQVYWD